MKTARSYASKSILFIVLSTMLLTSCKTEISTPKGSSGTVKEDHQKTTLSIDHPEQNAMVPLAVTVTGSSRDIPDNRKIWIVVFPLMANSYYPQDRSADLQADGKWTSVAYIGEKNKSTGEQFDIIAVLVDANAEMQFRNYIQRSKNANSYPGLGSLPQGVEIYSRITVQRQ